MRLLRQFLSLSSQERSLLFSAAWLLPIRALQLRVFGLKSVARRPLENTAWSPVTPDPSMTGRARRTQWLVTVAGQYGVWRGSCLSRSVVLADLLDRQRIPNELRIGVRNPLHGFAAHAWVEHAGMVLNDDADVASRFTPIPGASTRATTDIRPEGSR